MEGVEILIDDENISQELNSFYLNAVSNLNISENSFIRSNDHHELSDPVQKAIAKYKHHPSILLIQSKISN